MNRISIVILLSLFSMSGSFSQPDITLEDVWQNYTFLANSVPGFNFMADGKHFTRMERGKINQYDLTTGRFSQTIFDANAVSSNDFQGVNDYTFSADESKIMISSESESIYRRSYKAKFYVYDRQSSQIQPVFSKDKIRYATFNRQADKVAFVYENNLYCKDMTTGELKQLTTDGKTNEIINGGTDWVYEEEFAIAVGFQWSPDGQRIAYYRFDESEVKEFTMTHFRGGMYPEYETFKYPKVGEDNSKVSIHIYDLASGKTVLANTYLAEDHYIPRIKWTQDPQTLCILRMNRHQNKVELLLANASTGQTSTLFEETNKYYIEEGVLDNLSFLKDGKHFVWTSEMDGWHHIYLYDMKGKKVRQLTKGEWEVTAFHGIDEANGKVFYQAAKRNPMQREEYVVDLDGENEKVLAQQDGWNQAEYSSTFDYYVLNHSTINTPASYVVYDRTGNSIRTIEDNSFLKSKMKTYDVQPAEFFNFTTSEGVDLNGYMIKPRHFDPNQKYPVFMFLYGGPGSQQVVDNWRGQNYWWFQMLAQQGFLVACVDNRGTGARGEAFKKITYMQLGHYETIDQIEAAKYLGSLEYTDASNIGIFGWSYGGYMSSLCLLKGNDVFKAAIAVAPVTNWKWYDSIYTERFMRTEKENPDGYADNSPTNFADQLKGHYLLVHGMGDDNVHFQQTAEMANALITANKQYDTYFYPNRNHGISGGLTRLHLYQKMTNFLEDKLKATAVTRISPRAGRHPIELVPVENTNKKAKKKKTIKP
ncbi:MAG: S9 family peptidase [Saprospiraceae bacterium]